MTTLEIKRLHYKCKVFARAFELSSINGIDSINFAETVMTDSNIWWLYTTDDCQDWCDGEFLYSVIKSSTIITKGKAYDKYLMWFAGYLYKYWMSTRDISREQIYRILPLERLVASFGFYHTQDWDYVIEEATKAYNNKQYII